jgi:aryl-alcohol dehydrogenase-like predicted oxidoreductase
VAIRFTLDQKFLTSSIVGATNLEQLRADIEAADLDLPPEVLQGIEKIHAQRPNPVQ